jgi:PKD repeat protein
MWSWCGQVSGASEADIGNYLRMMSDLESDHTGIKFIYMTGHLDGTGPDGNLYQRNSQIREYVRANNKILFDFADIESYDPAGNYYPSGSDACSWCNDWCSTHTCPSCGECAHSNCFNCYNKAKAFWWLLARMAGWDGKPDTVIILPQNCTDGTLYKQCSQIKPRFCQDGVLKENCSKCGCEYGSECNITNGSCYKPVLRCDGGTAYGYCSAAKPWFCSNGFLVENCTTCGCSLGECAVDGKCYENHAPVIEPIGNREIKENETLEFTVKANDPDGDFITLFASGLPYGAAFEKNTGKFSWIPAYGQSGNYWVTFSAVDQGIPSLGDQEMIRITVGDVNRPPEIAPLADRSVDENILIEIYVHASDPDSDPIWYYASGLPYGATFEKSTGKFSWIPAFTQTGNYKIRFTASDGHYNISREITLTVGDVNRPPTAVISYPVGDQTFFVGNIIIFSAAGSSDPDTAKLSYAWDFGDGESSSGANPTAGHAYKNPGRFNVKLVVSDGFMQDEKTLGISISDAPAKDSDMDGVEDAKDKCPDTPLLAQVNEYGCQPPKYTKYDNNVTTDFSKVDLTNVTEVVIAVPDKAMIEFRGNSLNLVGKNLDKYIEMGDMNVTIKTGIAPDLNKSAVITFYNVTLEDPIIARDSVYCSDCKIISFENATLTFSVPHFTTYSLLSFISFSGYCGDNLCSVYESCSTCQEDCGSCRDAGAKPPKACEEMWVCSGWSECNELNIRTRECNDVNLCGTRDKKPSEALECGRGGSDFSSFILFGTIVTVLVFFYVITTTYKKRKENVKMDEFEMEKVVKGYVYRGYTSVEIKKMLLDKGYLESAINEVMKKVQKEIF